MYNSNILNLFCKNILDKIIPFFLIAVRSPTSAKIFVIPSPMDITPDAISRAFARHGKRKRRVSGAAVTKRRVDTLTRASRRREVYSIGVGITVDPNSTGAVVNCTAIAAGDDNDERTGRQIILKELSVAGTVTLHASATNTYMRMMVVRDKIGNTTPPLITDMFANIAQFHNNKQDKGTPQVANRFQVLYDQWIVMDAGHGLTQGFKFTRKLNSRCFYTGTTSTSEGTGNLYLFISSNETTNDPVVIGAVRVKWVNP